MIGRRLLAVGLALTAALLGSAPLAAQAQETAEETGASGPGFYATAGWTSTYVSLGREYLSRGGLLTGKLGLEWGGLYAFGWYAAGDTEDLEELDLCLGYAVERGGFEITADYTRLELLSDDAHDNWFGLGIAYSAFPWLVPKLLAVHSTVADGQYAAAMLSSAIPLFAERLTLSPYLLQSFDFGFATEEYDGANHFEAGFEAAFTLTDMVAIGGQMSHLWPQHDEKLQGLGEVTWGGASLTVSF